ncbi:MAG TPA: HAMP domain-containing sensor histidine kinase [Acidimicrobiia bacterium]
MAVELRRRGTIRFRLTALAAVAVAVVLAAAAIGLVLIQRTQLVAGVDASLQRRAQDIETLLGSGDSLPTALGGTEEDFVQLVTSGSQVTANSANLNGSSALPLSAPSTGTVIRTVEVPQVDDEQFRVLSRRVDATDGPALLHVGSALDDVGESVAILAGSLAVTIPVVVLLLAALVWWLVGRTLSPVEDIRAEVAEIGQAELGRRVPQPPGDDEIARLADTMNRMLDRLQESGTRQQAFVADASHELRSPLTRIRSNLEVDLASNQGGGSGATLATILEEVIGLQRLVEDLLHLARSDAGQGTTRAEPVDLDDLVLEAAQAARAEGKVTVDSSGVSGAQVMGDAHQLARAIRNLADNAVRHASQVVRLGLSESGEQVVLVIEDDGPGIPEEERERVFERFTRLDQARTPGQGGTGLGLAIARDIVERHGGTITVESGDDRGAKFVVTLPRSLQ